MKMHVFVQNFICQYELPDITSGSFPVLSNPAASGKVCNSLKNDDQCMEHLSVMSDSEQQIFI